MNWGWILQIGIILGERMRSKDEPQPLPLWGWALGSQVEAVSIILLPRAAQLTPAKGKPTLVALSPPA